MLDMYATANALSLMHLKDKLPRPSDSILLEKKSAKKKKGQEEYEAHLWKMLQKAMDIKAQMKKRKEARDAKKNIEDESVNQDSESEDEEKRTLKH